MIPHTQGPWRAGSGTAGKGSVVSDTLATGALSGSVALDYYGGNLIAESVAQENIPLIAAAPDLLAALIDLFDAVDRCELTPEAMDAARAAIAKATGSAA